MFYRSILIVAFALFTGAVMAQGTAGADTSKRAGTTLEPLVRDRAYDMDREPDRRLVPYPFMRQADIMWEKLVIREVDMREKINHPFYYPERPTNGRKNFISVVMDALLTDSDKYFAYDSKTDDFLIQMSSSDVANIGAYADTQWVPDPNPPYTLIPQVIRESFDPSTVTRFRIKEYWILEKQRSVMTVRIMGICPLRSVYDRSTGEFKYHSSMFWIYFPDFRPVLAVNEVYNPQNYAQRLSWDDVFEKRLFSSKILKVDNVYDRNIEEYTKGIPALLEGERIKGEIFTYEHDLWEQ